jgi:hypothetical protein
MTEMVPAIGELGADEIWKEPAGRILTTMPWRRRVAVTRR